MRFWLINPYGPIPGEGWREYRYSLIGRALAEAGHEAIWWTSSFAHHFKRQRCTGWMDREVTPGFTIRLVPTPSYRSNVSVARLRFETAYAIRVLRRARSAPPPDWIITVDPPQSASLLAERLAARTGAKLMVDLFDLWPELFTAAAPPLLRPAVRLAGKPLEWLRGRNLRRADRVTAVNDTYLRVALDAAPEHRDSARTVFIGLDLQETIEQMSAADHQEPVLPTGLRWAIYAGSLGHNYDVPTILRAAALLSDRGSDIGIAIAGDGPLASEVASAAERCSHLAFLGKLAPDRLAAAYGESTLALSTYAGFSTVALPTKLYDYLAAGLPMVNSLPGEMTDLLADHHVGVPYVAGDAASLADRITELAGDFARRDQMADRARELAHRFDTRRQYRALLQMLGAISPATAAEESGPPPSMGIATGS